MSVLRIATAVFKSNVRPFVERAKAGETVIVTCDGVDDFQVTPICPGRPLPLPIGCAVHDSEAELNAPAFEPMSDENPA